MIPEKINELMETVFQLQDSVTELMKANLSALAALIMELQKPKPGREWPELMSYDVLSEYLGKPKSSLYHLKSDGSLPSTVVGKTVMFRKCEIDEMIRRNTRMENSKVAALLNELTPTDKEHTR